MAPVVGALDPWLSGMTSRLPTGAADNWGSPGVAVPEGVYCPEKAEKQVKQWTEMPGRPSPRIADRAGHNRPEECGVYVLLEPFAGKPLEAVGLEETAKLFGGGRRTAEGGLPMAATPYRVWSRLW